MAHRRTQNAIEEAPRVVDPELKAIESSTSPRVPALALSPKQPDLINVPHLVSARTARTSRGTSRTSRVASPNLSIDVRHAVPHASEIVGIADDTNPEITPSPNWNLLSPSFAMEHVAGVHSGYSPKISSRKPRTEDDFFADSSVAAGAAATGTVASNSLVISGRSSNAVYPMPAEDLALPGQLSSRDDPLPRD